MIKDNDKKLRIILNSNILLCFVLVGVLFLYLFKLVTANNDFYVQVVAIIATIPVLFNALIALKNRSISIDLLASIALGASLIEGEWLSVIFINLMISSARVFSAYVKIKSHSAINSLLDLKPKKVKIDKDGRVYEVLLEEVRKGDTVIVELGERIPIDGLILKGEAAIDQSSLTGESNPVFKKEGDSVFSFTTVVSGHLILRADKVGKETTFEKIIALVEEAQGSKSPINSFINKFVKWYIIFTLVGTFFVYLFSGDVELVVSLLLVSCADDIAVAIPIALMSAITHSAKHGVVIKGGDYLDSLSKVKVVVFDKTGTLTQGKMKIKGVHLFNGSTEKEVLSLAAIPSSYSNHPIAQAIIEHVKSKGILIDNSKDFEEYEGRGMSAFYKEKNVLIGKISFFKDMKIDVDMMVNNNHEMFGEYNSTLVAYDGKLIGSIELIDEIREGAKQMIEELKNLGIEKTIMLTGDNEEVAEKVAEKVGIDEFYANLLPDGKMDFLKKLLNKKYKVAMVGDGVNDAPCLALSDVGIAMGAIGSDVSVEAADIALMKDDIFQISGLIRISQLTMNVIRQNIIIWGILNILGFVLVFLHVLNPSTAAAYNFICDLIPIFNSLRLFK